MFLDLSDFEVARETRAFKMAFPRSVCGCPPLFLALSRDPFEGFLLGMLLKHELTICMVLPHVYMYMYIYSTVCDSPIFLKKG